VTCAWQGIGLLIDVVAGLQRSYDRGCHLEFQPASRKRTNAA